MPDDPLLLARALQHRYDGTLVLDLPLLEVPEAQHTLLLGPSGSGKTTLLHVLAGLLRPDAGTVALKGQDVYALSETERDRLRGREVGIVFQQLHLIPALTALQNLTLAQSLAGLDVDAGRARGLLERLGVADRAGARPDALSQGQRQRVALARALVNRPALVLADEPTSALDDANAARVADLLLETAASEGATLVVATHDHRIAGRFERAVHLEDRTPAANP